MPRSTQLNSGRNLLARKPATVIGIDFSGAAQSGKTAWLAQCEVLDDQTLKLVSVDPLHRLAGSTGRDVVNAFLVERVLSAKRTLVGADFPFSLPTALGLGDWQSQLEHVAEFDGDAKQYGRMLVSRTERITGGQKHLRRQTDQQSRTPFDCYHYRIIYQTFHGMRDVLRPIVRSSQIAAGSSQVAVHPFESGKFDATTILAEACPSSTLKRLRLPHQLYKQGGNRPPEAKHLQTRRSIFSGISPLIKISPHRRRVLLADPGGDAIDAVLAAIGVWNAYQAKANQSPPQKNPHVAESQFADNQSAEGEVWF